MLDEYSIEQRATQILDAPSKESGRRNWGMAVNIGEQIGEQIAKSHCQFDLKSMTCGDDSVDASPPYTRARMISGPCGVNHKVATWSLYG